jgi:glutathione S-transferase
MPRPVKLYNHALAPNPRRVRIFAAEKGIELPLEEVDILAGQSRTPEFLAAIEALEGRTDALIVPRERLYNTNRIQINSLALRPQLLTIYFDRVYVEMGA